MVGIAILAVFLVFAAMMYLRWLPALLAVPLMAVAMGLVAGVPLGQVGDLVVTGAASLASVFVAVIFGAWLGRVTLDTGIARALVNLAAEYGGENPLVLSLVLSAVVALLFVSLSGLGAIIMVGSIVLPIMMTTGVPRKVAATLFLMAFALGFIFNLANWKFYTKFFNVEQHQLLGYAIVLALIDAVALIVYATLALRRERDYATWAVRAVDAPSAPGVPWYALIAPVLPIVLYFVLHIDPILSFALSAIYAALTTRPRNAIPTLVAAAIRGIEDVAPAVVLFIGIGMLLTMTKAPQFAAALQPLVAGGWTHNPVAFVVIFGILSPLTLYRGPLNPFGVGIAIFTVLLTSNALPPVVLVAAIMAVVQVQNVCDPTNTANVWVANFTGTPIVEITKRTLLYQVAVATLACVVIVAIPMTLFGIRPFASPIAPALADSLPSPGLFAPATSANNVVVDDDGSVLARAAAQAAADALNEAGDLHASRAHVDPGASDCANKPYAAYVDVTSTTFRLTAGTDLDIGIVLEDCGGWGVSEWHDHQVFASPNEDDAHALAQQGVARLREWVSAHPERASHLFHDGLAYAAGDPPTFYYALFKTIDGYMRTFVRAGGPAYAAGMRTNDIVDKLDGKFWWEYGTYQTQLRAYDGKPHSFEVERGKAIIDLQLGTPYSTS
jgi:H+/gluconate symporter-like permease